MAGETFIQAAQLGTILVGFLGVAVTLRSHRRQMHAQMFIEFSSRLHHVLGSLPVQIWESNEDGDQPIPPRHDELTRSCMQCFHIMASLYFLNRGGYISPDLWRTWQRGIRRTMQGPLLRREWNAVERAFTHNPDFCRYMQSVTQLEERKGPRWRYRLGA
jgi:hypothetical protein